jgi:hypothetical protein
VRGSSGRRGDDGEGPADVGRAVPAARLHAGTIGELGSRFCVRFVQDSELMFRVWSRFCANSRFFVLFGASCSAALQRPGKPLKCRYIAGK